MVEKIVECCTKLISGSCCEKIYVEIATHSHRFMMKIRKSLLSKEELSLVCGVYGKRTKYVRKIDNFFAPVDLVYD